MLMSTEGSQSKVVFFELKSMADGAKSLPRGSDLGFYAGTAQSSTANTACF